METDYKINHSNITMVTNTNYDISISSRQMWGKFKWHDGAVSNKVWNVTPQSPSHRQSSLLIIKFKKDNTNSFRI